MLPWVAHSMAKRRFFHKVTSLPYGGYIYNGDELGSFIPHHPNQRTSSQLPPSSPVPLTSPRPIHMDNYNPNFYSPSTSHEPGLHSFQGQTSAVGEFNNEAHGHLADDWGMVTYPTQTPGWLTMGYSTGKQGEYRPDLSRLVFDACNSRTGGS